QQLVVATCAQALTPPSPKGRGSQTIFQPGAPELENYHREGCLVLTFVPSKSIGVRRLALTSCAPAVNQNLTFPSYDAVASTFPSGEKARAVTVSVKPLRVIISW